MNNWKSSFALAMAAMGVTVSVAVHSQQSPDRGRVETGSQANAEPGTPYRPAAISTPR